MNLAVGGVAITALLINEKMARISFSGFAPKYPHMKVGVTSQILKCSCVVGTHWLNVIS